VRVIFLPPQIALPPPLHCENHAAVVLVYSLRGRANPFFMRYPGVVAYRLPIDPALQSQYDKESTFKVRDHLYCSAGVHPYRLLYPATLHRQVVERIRTAIEKRVGVCGSHPTRLEDF
jgi:hypothetical protein